MNPFAIGECIMDVVSLNERELWIEDLTQYGQLEPQSTEMQVPEWAADSPAEALPPCFSFMGAHFGQ